MGGRLILGCIRGRVFDAHVELDQSLEILAHLDFKLCEVLQTLDSRFAQILCLQTDKIKCDTNVPKLYYRGENIVRKGENADD